ncbi:helix-turn-helix domain-containing protein [Jidongwangia harbinensis]|uniref:helix-turn-helix domain-containing protein n=1 Tax=Jidongwangia harbinensis TaxID=2878561 RepID=UPI001CDA2A88|nr:helix-turn-helix domain-containing protein [Jidongwangia harbinensis]MCA2215265.1 helix-turn-helix domain-containing protein [Jidongwangia harbinensis]
MTVSVSAHRPPGPAPWLIGADPAGPQVDAGLRPWIDEVAVFTGGSRQTVVQAPDVASTLVVRSDPRGRAELIVTGPRTRGTYHPADGAPVCFRMRVRTGGTRALLGAPVSDLADRGTPIEDLWGAAGRRLAEDVAHAYETHRTGAPSGNRLFRQVAEALRERTRAVPGDPAAGRLVGAAVRALTPAAGPAPRLSVVADRLGVSERYLRTLFAREIGLSPKHFARIARLRRVLMQAGTRQWAHLAGDAGFFDQAHLITDFRALMGVSPGAYLAGRLPAPAPCLRTVTRVR